MFRFSQHKQQDYHARLGQTPKELGEILNALGDAGVDIMDASIRGFDTPAFEGSDLNLAGWAKKLTGKPSITVGSVALSGEFIGSFRGESSSATGIDELLDRLDRDEFDLVAVGRALLVDPAWARKVSEARYDELLPFKPEALATLS
jgi:2,4-dienoyl-CoA reductase-like NADH-dependent reductase (Old Yellow Enzyme family)